MSSSTTTKAYQRIQFQQSSTGKTRWGNPALNNFHPCRYDADLGSDDSDPESHSSNSSTSSQDSDQASSPATSYSSEESKADQQERLLTSQVNHGSLTVYGGHVSETDTPFPAPQTTRQVPYRPRPQQNPHQQAAQHAIVASHQAVNKSLSNELTPTPQHPRRGRMTDIAAPPTLRRDTDATDGIVHMIVFFCTNLINSIWCTSSQAATATPTTQQSSTVLPLRVFITETLRRSKTSYSTLQIALYYLILLKQCLPTQTAADKSGCRAMQCGRRMFLTSLILASKYLQDRNYSARAWSKISGLPLKEINENERRFLSIVNWDLHVPKCTFENWSKIVLQVCRKSQDMDGVCKRPLQLSCGSTAPISFVSMNQSTWWLVNLRQLRTDVVKCAIKTQQYVESVCPFRQDAPIFRPVSPESDLSEDCEERFADVLVKTSPSLRQPSLDRSSKQFEPVSDLLHPAAPLAMPPQPTLKNLPTPQSTPQSNVQSYWTPRLSHQNSNSSLRCRASASALGNAFKRHCPIANLETCPPPPPRNYASIQQTCLPTDTSSNTSTSVVSSPESTASDAFSAVSRSRSSSISSTSSWATSSLHSVDLQCFVGNSSNAPSLACPRQPPNIGCAPRAEQAIERPRTAFKNCQDSQMKYDQVNNWSAENDTKLVGTIDAGHDSDEARKKKQEVAQILAGLRVDESVVRSRARPVLARSITQIYKPVEEQGTKVQPLKRSRSDTFSLMARPCPTPSVKPISLEGSPWQAFDLHHAMQLNECYKKVQQPTQCWAQPRKPLQTGSQSCKRRALQISQSSPAVERARYLLQPDVATSFCV